MKRLAGLLANIALLLLILGWRYQQLPMEECAWCHRTGRWIGLNRHHIIPQSVRPDLRDEKGNLIVLCRDCHLVLGHRHNWKTYNPDVAEMCARYTNCVSIYGDKEPWKRFHTEGTESTERTMKSRKWKLGLAPGSSRSVRWFA